MYVHKQCFTDEANAIIASSPNVYCISAQHLKSLHRLAFLSATNYLHAERCTLATCEATPRLTGISRSSAHDHPISNSSQKGSGSSLVPLIMMLALFVFASFMSGSAFGQELPDNPQPKNTVYQDCTGWVWHQHCRDIAVAAPLVEHRKSNNTIDVPFIIFHSISFAGAFADGFISHRYVKPQNRCYEVNPFLGKYPSAAKTYGMTLGTWGLVTTMDYFIKKSRHDGWEVPAMGETLVHGIGVGMTYQNCHF